MKKLAIIGFMFMSLTLNAQEVPEYLKDGQITVTLANGKSYKFSSNEYAVIKRNAKPTPQLNLAQDAASLEISKAEKAAILAAPLEAERHRNIVSVELVNGQKGFNVSQGPSKVDVETRRKTGVGAMYQNNIHKDLYIGIRGDTNGSGAVNLGIGF